MKKGWETRSLGEIADVEYGFTDKSTDKGYYRYIRITDIDDNGELISTDKKYIKHTKGAEDYLINDCDLLMARTGATFAKVLLCNISEPSVFASYLIRIKFKDKIENKLYWYYSKTRAYWEQANSLMTGAAQPQFNGAALKKVVFSYPKSISEQQRVIAILDKAFAVIDKAKANTEKNLRNVRELFESYLHRVFEKESENWVQMRLTECLVLKSGDNLISKNMLDNGRYPVFGGNGIVGYYNNFNLDGSNVIIGRVGALCGNVRHISGKIWLTDNAFKVIDSDELFDNVFLTYLLNYKNLRSYARQAAQPVISNSSLKDVILNFPLSKKSQQEVARKFDSFKSKVQSINDVYQKKINDLEDLKKSILCKAFNGEL